MNRRDIRFNISLELMEKVDRYFWNDHPHLIGSYVPTGARISYVLTKATEKK